MLTRRRFVELGAILSGVLATGCNRSHSNWDFLTIENSRTLCVLCDQIIPPDDYPSASQAGVLTYIDRQLARHYKKHRKTYERGLEQAEQLSQQMFHGQLAALTEDQQYQVVAAIEKQNKPFFDLVRNHTMEGYYGTPRHGGNRDAISWKMLGLDEPPVRGRAQYDLRKSSQS